MSWFGFLLVALIILKLVGLIAISWWLVFIPLYVILLWGVIVLVIALVATL